MGKTCEVCGKGFTVIPARASTARFCSVACKHRGHANDMAGSKHPAWKGMTAICALCQKPFHIKPSKLKRGEGKYCSMYCYNQAKRGTQTGIENPNWKPKVIIYCEQCGQELAVPPSWANKRFCSIQCKAQWQSDNLSGEHAAAWLGGTSAEPYSWEFITVIAPQIRQRDEYQCRVCGRSGVKTVHHIDYNKSNCKEDNLLTLCKSCHGKTNHHRNDWQAALVKLVREQANPPLFVI